MARVEMGGDGGHRQGHHNAHDQVDYMASGLGEGQLGFVTGSMFMVGADGGSPGASAVHSAAVAGGRRAAGGTRGLLSH